VLIQQIQLLALLRESTTFKGLDLLPFDGHRKETLSGQTVAAQTSLKVATNLETTLE
jgi:hypothetical protein